MTEIRNFLTNQKDANGSHNLYDHLANVLGKMLLDNTDNAYDLFEEYSHDVKFSGHNYKTDTNFEHKPRMRETYSDVKEWADKATTNLDVNTLYNFLTSIYFVLFLWSNLLYQKLNLGTEEEPQEPGQCGYVPNLLEEMKKFEWAGISFGEEDTFHLQKTLTVKNL